MNEFSDLVKSRHAYAKAWKERTAGQVIGYLCTYVPEEILYAAGMLPVRIFGSHEPQDVTEPFVYTAMYCPFCRDCLAQALKGRYDYLDGLVKARSCLHMRNTYGAWLTVVPTPYHHFIDAPLKVQSPHAQAFLRQEFAFFKDSLEKWTGRSITAEALDRASDVYNTNRRLLRQLYELRKSDRPSISGAEAMEITLAGQVMDKQEHTLLLRKLLDRLREQKDGASTEVRLMLVGSEDDDVDFLRVLESLGATVVIDDHCTGSRYFWNEVIPEEDELSALAARYIKKPVCAARDFPEHQRWQHILRLAQDYRVDGAIILVQKFCTPQQFGTPGLQRVLKEKLAIPSLVLEYDLGVPAGQFRTRVEAFLEILKNG